MSQALHHPAPPNAPPDLDSPWNPALDFDRELLREALEAEDSAEALRPAIDWILTRVFESPEGAQPDPETSAKIRLLKKKEHHVGASIAYLLTINSPLGYQAAHTLGHLAVAAMQAQLPEEDRSSELCYSHTLDLRKVVVAIIQFRPDSTLSGVAFFREALDAPEISDRTHVNAAFAQSVSLVRQLMSGEVLLGSRRAAPRQNPGPRYRDIVAVPSRQQRAEWLRQMQEQLQGRSAGSTYDVSFQHDGDNDEEEGIAQLRIGAKTTSPRRDLTRETLARDARVIASTPTWACPSIYPLSLWLPAVIRLRHKVRDESVVAWILLSAAVPLSIARLETLHLAPTADADTVALDDNGQLVFQVGRAQQFTVALRLAPALYSRIRSGLQVRAADSWMDAARRALHYHLEGFTLENIQRSARRSLSLADPGMDDCPLAILSGEFSQAATIPLVYRSIRTQHLQSTWSSALRNLIETFSPHPRLGQEDLDFLAQHWLGPADTLTDGEIGACALIDAGWVVQARSALRGALRRAATQFDDPHQDRALLMRATCAWQWLLFEIVQSSGMRPAALNHPLLLIFAHGRLHLHLFDKDCLGVGPRLLVFSHSASAQYVTLLKQLARELSRLKHTRLTRDWRDLLDAIRQMPAARSQWRVLVLPRTPPDGGEAITLHTMLLHLRSLGVRGEGLPDNSTRHSFADRASQLAGDRSVAAWMGHFAQPLSLTDPLSGAPLLATGLPDHPHDWLLPGFTRI